jgi:nitroimidazol reductase NimA-like FMN-containing flavoprotein (pyridoxamine 5'-phosphate oxidase superfamily)
MTSSEEQPEVVAIDIVSRMGVISHERCVELMQSTPIGRVAFVADTGEILALPVNFKWHEDSVVFRTLEGQKLAAATEGKPVCFEVDQWDAESRSGWSVVVQGNAREVTNWAEVEQLEGIGLVPWAKEKWRRMWVRIEPTNVSGRILS